MSFNQTCFQMTDKNLMVGLIKQEIEEELVPMDKKAPSNTENTIPSDSSTISETDQAKPVPESSKVTVKMEGDGEDSSGEDETSNDDSSDEESAEEMVYYCAVSDLEPEEEDAEEQMIPEDMEEDESSHEELDSDGDRDKPIPRLKDLDPKSSDFLEQAEAILAAKEAPKRRKRRGRKSPLEDDDLLKAEECQCLYCDFTSSFQPVVDRHTINVHSKDPGLTGKFPCNVCVEVLWTEKSFDLHIRKEHPDYAKSKCRFCYLQVPHCGLLTCSHLTDLLFLVPQSTGAEGTFRQCSPGRAKSCCFLLQLV